MKQLYLIIAVVLCMTFMTACSSDEPTTDNTVEELGLTPAEVVVGEDMGEFNTYVNQPVAVELKGDRKSVV